MEVVPILSELVTKNASDIFIIAGRPLSFRFGQTILTRPETALTPGNTHDLIMQIYKLAHDRDMSRLNEHGDDDFSFSIPKVSRFRVNAYKQRGSLAAVIRVVTFDLPSSRELNIPDSVMRISENRRGLVIVTGPAGSGKTTTLACMVDKINHERNGHIITLENPIEYLHSHDKCIISQREISLDTISYADALRAALRQSPDVILIGEMRDSETISTALTAAETGHFVISSLHTLGAANTIDRLVDTFPASQQEQVRMQLSMVLQSVVSQQLVPTIKGGKSMPVFEVMHCNNAIRNLIREGRTHQINSMIHSSGAEQMCTMDAGLFDLVRKGVIDSSVALTHSMNPEAMQKQINVQYAISHPYLDK